MNILQNFRESISAIRANLVRTGLTMAMIAIGITALIGVLTAIDGIKFWFSNRFISLGSNTFRIEYRETNLRQRGPQEASTNPIISWHQARRFKNEFSTKAPVSIVAMASMTATAKFGSDETQNNLQLFGTDENYIQTANYSLARGRNINPADVTLMRNVIILGHEPAKLLFDKADPLGKHVQVNGKAFEIIGVFTEQGASGAQGGDRICVIPATRVPKDFPQSNLSYSLQVYAKDLEKIDETIEEARGLLRRIRGLRPREEDNFGILKSQAIVDNLMEDLQFLTWSATAIAIITLVSASIGLMNIMLVSVTERTREIGVRKALGATRRNIQLQFLTEAIMICQLGGLAGIALGILLGNLVSLFLGMDFMVPWFWVGAGLAICTLVGLVSGMYPANKASKLDPIESLRYE